MRTIRFRAWDKLNNLMCEVDEIHWCKGGIMVFGPGHHIANDWLKNDEIILMQYTGYKARNGVEIYEGDIIYAKIDNGGDGIDEPYIVDEVQGTVIMKDGCFGFEDKDNGFYGIDVADHHDVEIIGNIHKED
ncbi:MAG: YopX family protein [Firmicutes bacterium]|nr:YopX family protein [Bacillota bacterium]